MAHEFIDVTDRPYPTVDAAPRCRIVIERSDLAAPVRPQNKPAYCVPTMAEIAATPLNGYRVASTFSGCGGSSLGYRMAGFKVIWANEFIVPAQQTYRANFPDTILDTRDIRAISPGEVLETTGLGVGDLDVLDGSPPCSSFSMAGKRQAGWGKVKPYSDGRAQRTDDLFHEFVRLVAGIQPRVFVAENVSGLVKGVGKGHFLEILRDLKGAGYRVAAQLLDAQWLGVPQARQRLIFMGVRRDLSTDPAFPAPLAYRYSVRDALPGIDVKEVGGIRQTGYSAGKRSPASEPSPTIMAGGGNGMNTSQFGIVVEGANGFNGHAFRSIDKPAATVQASRPLRVKTTVDNVPTTECRRFTIPELRRICAFPDDFILTGSYGEQWERLGRAVPPVMMAAIAQAVRDRVLDPLERRKGADCSTPLRTVA